MLVVGWMGIYIRHGTHTHTYTSPTNQPTDLVLLVVDQGQKDLVGQQLQGLEGAGPADLQDQERLLSCFYDAA